jgi:OOP family OmpA-OmpF porin
MKKLLCIFLILFSLICSSGICHSQLVDKLKNKAKAKIDQRADEKTDKAMDKTLDDVDNSVKGDKTKTKEKTKDTSGAEIKTKAKGEPAMNGGEKAPPVQQDQASIKVYQNYDFVPGDKILFEDHFTDDQDGEFPAHWELEKGQALLNKLDGQKAFFLTEGNYVSVLPRMKTSPYLTDPFTVEFDYYHKPGAYKMLTFLKFHNPDCDCESTASVGINESEAIFDGAVSFNKPYPAEMAGDDNFSSKWHHVAIAVKNHQLKVYVDQNRVLVVPDTKSDFHTLGFGGTGEEENPLIFKNVRIASGGNMNMIGKKFTEAKIVTHGINFDIDKATIKPESMGTLNMIVQVMKENPDIKFEVDGHTDNSGTAAHNLTLSQQRATAVREQLIQMGIDASRLTAKGLGDTKPISDNNSLEGKANNRRVEFVKN